MEQAMNNVVDKWQDGTKTKTTTTTTTSTASRPVAETRNTYRQIRSSNVTSDDSQAVSCSEENDKYKMMVDVKDFKPGDITVKTVDDTVVVEGKIEQKEGNSIKTQVFTRRFMLPNTVNLNAVTSAMSRDGVLTINAPKLAAYVTSGRPTSRTVEYRSVTPAPRRNSGLGSMPAAGKPSVSNGPDRRYLQHTPLGKDGHHIVTTVLGDGSGRWTSFNEMVEKSQRRDGGHDAPLTPSSPPPRNWRCPRPPPSCHGLLRASAGAAVGGQPRPGLHRTNRVLNENTDLKAADGSKRSEQESHAEGEREELMPDGSKKKTFTKSYETRKVYSYNSSDPKAQ
ncbi:Protein lethal(2)essential for life [Chionoecetes opilio]|uniref:Protein lethal(2)essential for life n=1 Tax=Chionoecetes opilio TaxID=41210 RepID=A0A8J4YE01_CHIOP|nr:Protein lethal(2)essential for life [Chionoecetes opilio]